MPCRPARLRDRIDVRHAPLLVPALGFLVGIVAETHALFVPLGMLVIALGLFRREAAAALVCGVLIGHVHGHPAIVTRELPTARYAGTITGDLRSNDDGFLTFPISIDGIGTLRANANAKLAAGERVVLRGRISPFDVPRNPGEPSARAIALDDGLVGEMRVSAVLQRERPDLHDIRVWMPLARAWASSIVRAYVPEPDASVLAGALWGERSTLPHALRDDFQATGTVHVLVTAGLHLGVIAALAAWACTLLGVPRTAGSLTTIPLVYAYACFSGWHLPSQRAAAMITVALIARACGARPVTLNTLALAAIVVAAAWPVALESISFALSFSCVAAIVLFADHLGTWLHAQRLPEPIADALALTTATQLGVWPLTAATFFTVAPYAVIANAIVVPLIGAIMLGGLAILVVHASLPLAAIVARWDDWLLTIAVGATHVIAQLPGARLRIPPPPLWAIAAYDGTVVIAAIIMRRYPRLAFIFLAVASLGVAASSLPRGPGAFTITMLDVGQGDGIVLRTPRGHTILIDTGGRLERGATIDGSSPAERSADRIVLPYLIRAGITHVDLLILTHPHGDHVGGCLGILNNFSVGEILDSGQSYAGRAYADCRHAAIAHHVPVHVVKRGMRWSTDDGIAIDILAPTDTPLVDTGDDVNENSIVARLSYTCTGGPFTALFMGDAGMVREAELLRSGIDLHADFLKVGHHGSRYASTPVFIAAVRPSLAAISVGRHNLFGHPARSTIETLRKSGARVDRTDRCGAITTTIQTHRDARVSTMLECISAPAP